MVDVRILSLSIILLCTACAKKPAPKAPAAAPAVEDKDTEAPGEKTKEAPASTTKPRTGDPCSGGENRG